MIPERAGPLLRVLLVENNGGIVERFLRAAGYDVTTVRSSDQMSRSLHTGYDIVVINMGVGNDVEMETYRAAKNGEPELPVLAVADIRRELLTEEVTSVIHRGDLSSRLEDKIEDTLERHIRRTLERALEETDEILRSEQLFLDALSEGHVRKTR